MGLTLLLWEGVQSGSCCLYLFDPRSSMRRIARFLLLCFIAVALPFQGALAMTGVGCAGEFNGAHEHSELYVHVGDATDGSNAGLGHHHDELGQASSPHATHVHQHGGSSKAGCSVCASCCSSTAPAPTLASFERQRVEMATVRLSLTSAPVTFVTGGPERPPRSSLG